VTWLDGKPLGEGGVQLAMPEAEQEALHQSLGAELARLHVASDAMTRPEAFEREILDLEALLGDTPSWGRFWENASLSEEEAALLLSCREKLQTEIGAHAEAGGDFGLIHADALRENVLVQDGIARLIDFDDGVFGFRMYELGVAMSQNWDQSNEAALGEALLRGYGTVRSLPEGAAQLLKAFTVMRAMASCGWVIGRYADDHPAVRDYAERAIAMAERYLA
jgi:Ser/Thr protein kinase RdoA (MazF antagonist)